MRRQTSREIRALGLTRKPWSLTDKLRLRLLAKTWIASRFPGFWDWLREGVRRSTCCELSECWNEPTCMWDDHRVCSEHYAKIAKIAAADRARRRRGGRS